MNPLYLDRIEVTYCPQDSVNFILELGGVSSQRDGVKFEIDCNRNPRNITGYRGKLMKDFLRLKAMGCVIRPVPNEEGRLKAEAKAKAADASTKTPGRKAASVKGPTDALPKFA